MLKILQKWFVGTENLILNIIIIIRVFFFSDGTTAQCEPSPPGLIYPNHLCFFDLSFHLFILHLLISASTQSDHLFFGRTLFRLPWELLLNTYFSFTVQERLFAKITFNYTNEQK